MRQFLICCAAGCGWNTADERRRLLAEDKDIESVGCGLRLPLFLRLWPGRTGNKLIGQDKQLTCHAAIRRTGNTSSHTLPRAPRTACRSLEQGWLSWEWIEWIFFLCLSSIFEILLHCYSGKPVSDFCVRTAHDSSLYWCFCGIALWEKYWLVIQ